MLIQIDEQFRITKDKSGMNLQLEILEDIKERETGTIKREWKVCGYHGYSTGSVLKQYKQKAIFHDDNLKIINQILGKLNEIDLAIDKAVKNIKLAAKNDDWSYLSHM